MSDLARSEDTEQARIMLGLLESVERNGAQTQRGLASELGIALGLVNAYLKRCMKKGLVKVRQAPAHRYAYYLTPQGFAEKSRLTLDYLTYSFSFFREARADCTEIFAVAKRRGWTRIVLIGKSDLAEIARICALECDIDIVAIVEEQADAPAAFIGVPVVGSLTAVGTELDGAIVTDLRLTAEKFAALNAALGDTRVLVPTLLGVRASAEEAVVP